MTIPGGANALLLASIAEESGYKIERSLRFNSADSANLSRTFSSSGNRSTWTLSWWMKLGKLSGNRGLFGMPGTSSSSPQFYSRIGSDHKLYVYEYNTSGTYQFIKKTDAVLRDPSAWYHCVFQFDSTQSTAEDGFKIYINGTRVTSWATNNLTNYSQNYQGAWNSNANTGVHVIGRSDDYFDGYMAEIHFVDGTALAPTDFGEYDDDNNWNPKEFSGTYGTNGFFLNFSDNSSKAALGTDSSGNSNTFTVNNLAVAAGPLNSSRGTNYDDDSATYTEYGTVSQATGQTLPMSNPSHYEGAAMRVNTGGFKVVTTNSATTDFFMACWVKFDSLANGYQMGVDLQGSYKYFEVRSNGTVKVRHTGGGSTDSSAGTLSSNTWTHIALSRSGGTLRAFVNGTIACSTTAGVSGDTISANEEFNFFGQSGTLYNMPGYLLDPVVYIGAGRSTNYTAPTAPLITSAGAVNDVAGMSSSNRYYASPLISVGDGIEGFDSMIDTPTNYTASPNNGGNYCTLNPLDTIVSLTNGNLETNTSSGWQSTRATFGMSSGKWYWETQNKQTAAAILGISGNSAPMTSGLIFGSNANPAWAWAGANRYFNGSSAGTGLSNHSATDIVMYALDVDAGKLWFGRNGTWYDSSWGSTGNPATGANATVSGLSTTETWRPAASFFNGAAVFNFGQRSFAHTPPTGFKSLCTTNLPDPTIADGSAAFDTLTYTGNATTGTSITGLNHSPDLLWIKSRSSTQWHYLVDTVRGVTKNVASNDTYPEETRTNRLLSFDSNGFTIGNNNTVNENNQGFVAWSWKAGTSTANNTDGTITTSVRVSPTNGFSIATYTGNGNANQTLGHGLNAAPSFVLIKDRTSSQNWAVLHTSAGTLGTLDGGTNYKLLELNAGAAARDASYNTIWHPTSTTVKIGEGASSAHWTNKNGDDYVMFSWAPVDQYSSFGAYVGNGSADGPFIYTGFRVRYLLQKRTDSSGSWAIKDAAREPYNVVDTRLYADGTNSDMQQTSFHEVDFLSNGFKVRSPGGGEDNANNATFVYAAFAEHPFKTARAR